MEIDRKDGLTMEKVYFAYSREELLNQITMSKIGEVKYALPVYNSLFSS